jgi:hypothetical protein
VLNPLFKPFGNPPTFSEGNLKIAPNASAYQNTFSTIGASSGKWYAELLCGGTPNSANYFGVSSAEEVNYLAVNSNVIGGTSTGYSIMAQTGDKRTAGAETSYGTGFVNNDIMQFALDLDNSKVYFGKNGTWFASGDPVAGTNAAFTGLSGTFFIGGVLYNGGFTSVTANFGQSGFTYTPPTDFLALSTANLPEPSISPLYGASPQDHFNTVTYTGDGTTSHAITNVGFQPDLVWVKGRDETYYHRLTSIGLTQPNYLATNATDAESSGNNTISSLDSNGFTVDATGTGGTNESAINYVAWNWKASNATAVSNTEGTITSQVSANTTAGFSIVTYTGNGSSSATVGHGLGVVPAMVITKGRSGVTEWMVKHQSLPTGQNLILNQTLAASSSLAFSQGVIANLTSSTTFGFTSGSSGVDNANQSGITFVAYCFHDVEGYSQFGSYTGNGSATEGPFVYTGFRPAFVIAKRTDSANSWTIQDNKRDLDNPVEKYLLADDSGAEGTSGLDFDFLSNGFKLRTTSAAVNASSGAYIYMAFAENPFKYSVAR